MLFTYADASVDTVDAAIDMAAGGSLAFKQPIDINISVPLCFKSHFEVARDLVLAGGAADSWPLHEVSFKNVSLLQVRAQQVLSSARISADREATKADKGKAIDDPLDAAIAASKMMERPVQRRVRRKKKAATPKVAPPTSASSDSDTSSAGSASSSSSSGQSVVVGPADVAASSSAAPAAPAPAPAPAPKTSFFYIVSALGVLPNSVQFDQARKSHCHVCQLDIVRKTGRVKYAYHERRPHGFCHLSCVHLLERGFLDAPLQDCCLFWWKQTHIYIYIYIYV